MTDEHRLRTPFTSDPERLGAVLSDVKRATERVRSDVEVLSEAVDELQAVLGADGQLAAGGRQGLGSGHPPSATGRVVSWADDEGVAELARRRFAEPVAGDEGDEIPLPGWYEIPWLVFFRPIQLRRYFGAWRELDEPLRRQAVRWFIFRMILLLAVVSGGVTVLLGVGVERAGFPFSWPDVSLGFVVGLASGLVFGLAFALFSAQVSGAVSGTVVMVIHGMVYGVGFGVVAGAANHPFPRIIASGTSRLPEALSHDAVVLPLVGLAAGLLLGLVDRLLAVSRGWGRGIGMTIAPGLALGLALGGFFAFTLHGVDEGVPSIGGGVLFIIYFGLVCGVLFGGLAGVLPDPLTMMVLAAVAATVAGSSYNAESGLIFGFGFFVAALCLRMLEGRWEAAPKGSREGPAGADA